MSALLSHRRGSIAEVDLVYLTRTETWELVHVLLEAIDDLESSSESRDTLVGEIDLWVLMLLERYYRIDD